jgi:hypothetical protein
MVKAKGPVPDHIQSSFDPLPQFSEKKGHDIEIDAVEPDYDDLSTDKIYVPGEDEEFIDPRLKDYPIPLVA